MSSFKKKRNDSYEVKKSDIEFYKMTGVFAVACVFILLVLKMKDTGLERIASGRNLTYNFYQMCHTPLFALVAILAVAASVVWFVLSMKKKIDESYRVFSSKSCLALVLYLLFFCACFGFYFQSPLHSFFIVCTVCLMLLYYASKLYAVDFMVYSSLTSLFAVAVYLWAMKFEPHMVVLKLLICAFAVVACVLFKRRLSNLKVSKQRKSEFLVFPSYIVSAIGILFMFWAYFQNMEFFRASEALLKLQSAIFLNRSMMLMVIFVQYIVFAIVYTVRRIKD